MKKFLTVMLVLSVVLCGCSILEDPVTTTTTAPNTSEKPPVDDKPNIEVDFDKVDEGMFTDRDTSGDYSEDKAVIIQLNGDSVTCNSTGVKVSGTRVTILKKGTYILRGTLNNGSVEVSADEDKVQLVLDGANIYSADSAALYIPGGDKVFVTLAEGSENTLSNGGVLPDTIDGAVFSKQDLSFNGTGSLTVESPVGHGIVCKDDLVVAGGSYTIRAASHGFDINDSFRMKSGAVTVDSGKDGIHVEDNDNASTGFVYISGGSLAIEAEGDGISAALTMEINGGDIQILAGGGYKNGASHSSGNWGDFMGGGGMGGRPPRPRATATSTTDEASTSMKGLKAKNGLLINDGSITIDSADDGVHSEAVVMITGGTLHIASGDDGIHTDTDLAIQGGTVEISTSYEGLEAVNVHITDGKISMIATDDGINAAGGTDSSGGGGRDQMFGGHGGASNGCIVIDGGDLYIQSSGDGMDANGYLEINGGKTVICGPNSGDTATLDFDTTGTINGGIFIGTGSSFMAQTFSENQQGVLAIQTNEASGVTLTVTDKDGKVLLTHQPALPFSVFIFSSPELISGQTYHISIGDKEGDTQAY